MRDEKKTINQVRSTAEKHRDVFFWCKNIKSRFLVKQKSNYWNLLYTLTHKLTLNLNTWELFFFAFLLFVSFRNSKWYWFCDVENQLSSLSLIKINKALKFYLDSLLVIFNVSSLINFRFIHPLHSHGSWKFSVFLICFCVFNRWLKNINQNEIFRGHKL